MIEMKAIFTAIAVMLLASVSLAQSNARQTLDQIKTLDGTWTGKNSHGEPLKVTFRETAGGSAILSEIDGEHGHDMVSMIHVDNDRLLMTHYCSTGNQARMSASLSPDGKAITFNYVDATNLKSPDAGHMQKVVFTMPDADHHNEEWTFVDHGKTLVEVFTLMRTDTLASKE
jgi:hypothetical protein